MDKLRLRGCVISIVLGFLIGLVTTYLYMEQKYAKQSELQYYLYKSVYLEHNIKLMKDYEESSLDGLLNTLKKTIDCNGYYIREEIEQKEREEDYYQMFFILAKEYANKYHVPARDCHAKTRQRLGLVKQ